MDSACLGVVVDAKIADTLSLNPEGVHIDEIARKSRLDKLKLGRILRYLASKHVFIEGVQPLLL